MSKIREWIIPISMVIGILFAPYLQKLSVLAPYLIMVVLLFSFSSISVKDIRIKKEHVLLLAYQYVVGLALYLVLNHINEGVAQGVLLCMIAPTSGAAITIIRFTKGDEKFVANFFLLSNVCLTIATPIFLSVIQHTAIAHPVEKSPLEVMFKVGSIVLLPLGGILLMGQLLPKLKLKIAQYKSSSFYFLAAAVCFITAHTVEDLKDDKSLTTAGLIGMIAGSLLAVAMLFGVGYLLGKRFDKKVEASEGLGRKSMVVSLWISHAFLSPISAIIPSLYIIWQNLINSLQLHFAARKERKEKNKAEY